MDGPDPHAKQGSRVGAKMEDSWGMSLMQWASGMMVRKGHVQQGQKAGTNIQHCYSLRVMGSHLEISSQRVTRASWYFRKTDAEGCTGGGWKGRERNQLSGCCSIWAKDELISGSRTRERRMALKVIICCLVVLMYFCQELLL